MRVARYDEVLTIQGRHQEVSRQVLESRNHVLQANLSLEERALGTEELILCAAAVVGVVLAALKLWWEIRKDRITTRQILDHISSLRESMKQNAMAVKKLEAICDTLQKAADAKLTTSSVKAIEERKLALKEAELARKREKDEWGKVVAVAKGIGWILDKMGEEEED